MKLLLSTIVTLFCLLNTTATWASGEHGHHDEGHQQEAVGPHGGKLLSHDDISVEFTVAHGDGVPQFRIWVNKGEVSIDKANIVLTLKRLQESAVRVRFHHQDNYWQGDIPANEPHSYDLALTLSFEGKKYQWEWSAYENRVQIDDEMANKNGLTSAIAEAGNIEQKLRVFGRLTSSPDNTANIAARFPGIVQSVLVNIGDRVKKGQKLATVESNKSLQNYAITSPIEGIVQHRRVNVGEVAGEQILFNILNVDALWAELKVFHNQRAYVKQGQPVKLLDDDDIVVSSIHHLIPGPANEPYLLARVKFDNSDRQHTPGDLISADIVVAETPVRIKVANRALHQLDGKTVIFIKQGEFYEPRQVKVGHSDSTYSEILSGIAVGTPYALDNSYLIKADIEKSGAGHAH